MFGRSMARAGIVGDISRLRAIRVENDRVVVEAGATWREVLGATLPRGLTPPVLTDYLDLSVGGTLAVGGVGGTTSHFGVQCDNVLALEVVTGQGSEGHLLGKPPCTSCSMPSARASARWAS